LAKKIELLSSHQLLIPRFWILSGTVLQVSANFCSEKDNRLWSQSNDTKQREAPLPTTTEDPIINNKRFGEPSVGNEVQVLIDGLETFRSYYEVLAFSQLCIPTVVSDDDGSPAFNQNTSMGIILVVWAGDIQ
jgi:hypothetical protein